MKVRRTALAVLGISVLAGALVAAGCSSSQTSQGAATSGAAAGTTPPTTSAGAGGTSPSPQATATQTGALTGEAVTAAAGDIPDNQVFLTVTDKTAGFSMKYPEGWAQKSAGGELTIQDKNNIVHVTVTKASAPTLSAVGQELGALKAKTPSLKAGVPSTDTIAGRPSIVVKYSTVSAPNPVTGKTVTLVVDRYYFWSNGRVAVVDLGTPQGVDNVDAYRMMSASFRWLL
jgi:hypothetical protein